VQGPWEKYQKSGKTKIHYTDEQIETLKATSPEVVKQAIGKMNETERTALSKAIDAYNKKYNIHRSALDPLGELEQKYAVPAPDDPYAGFSSPVERWKSAPIYLEMQSGQSFALIPSATKEQIDEIKIDYLRIQNDILTKARFAFVGTYFLIWMIPCLSILALALGLRWVVHGFKGQPI